jgi:hypothetical protein
MAATIAGRRWRLEEFAVHRGSLKPVEDRRIQLRCIEPALEIETARDADMRLRTFSHSILFSFAKHGD